MPRWTGIREGKLLALTSSDFDPARNRLSVTKTYQRIGGKDRVGAAEDGVLVAYRGHPEIPGRGGRRLHSPEPRARGRAHLPRHQAPPVPRDAQGSPHAGTKRIRVNDLCHSHVSPLMQLSFNVPAIAERMDHESINITYRYAHPLPDRKGEMTERLEGAGRR